MPHGRFSTHLNLMTQASLPIRYEAVYHEQRYIRTCVRNIEETPSTPGMLATRWVLPRLENRSEAEALQGKRVLT